MYAYVQQVRCVLFQIWVGLGSIAAHLCKCVSFMGDYTDSSAVCLSFWRWV